MSKKKSFSGSATMTLKDFHGGSIPSDLPLPSAPGLLVRPPDRPGAWGAAATGSAGRPEHHRPRPGSAGGARGGFDERGGSHFLPNPAHIGRHFDEDERKPFDSSSSSSPRRPAAAPVADPALPAPLPAARSDPKRPISAPVFPPTGSGSVGPTLNAWAVRKDAAIEPPQANSSTILSGPAVASRFAQASAIEKVSSGRWQSKPPDVEVIRFQEVTEGLDRRFGESVRIVDDGDRDFQRERARTVAYPDVKERNLADRAQEQERVRSPLPPEVKERGGVGFYNDEVPQASKEGRFGGLVDVSERSKVKFLPRMKPMELSETWVFDDKQGYQQPVDPVHKEHAHEMHGSVNVLKPGSAGADVGGRVVERPKLNLKPRSQPVEQLGESAEKARKTVFGGARPRELVLKERGVDNIVACNFEVTSPANRVKHDIAKTDLKLEPAAPTIRHGERAEGFPYEQRSGRDLERKDSRPDLEKVDAQKTSWRNDSHKNTREIEKPVERRQEPDTWCKPVEQPKPDAQGPRYGKAASALELAQAFSRSDSDAGSDDRYTSQRSLPGRSQVPFSRLTGTREFYSGPSQRQINGY